VESKELLLLKEIKNEIYRKNQNSASDFFSFPAILKKMQRNNRNKLLFTANTSICTLANERLKKTC